MVPARAHTVWQFFPEHCHPRIATPPAPPYGTRGSTTTGGQLVRIGRLQQIWERQASRGELREASV